MKQDYDPCGISIPNGNYFAMPFTAEESDLVLISVPWDVTTSYNSGASRGPDAIIEASYQMDYYDFNNPQGYKRKIATIETDYTILETSRKLREEAEKVIIHLESGGMPHEQYAKRKLKKINDASRRLNKHVHSESWKWLAAGKLVGLVGGDHSVSYGMIKSVAEKEGEIGILHLDAHCDLRKAYEGFEYSHASIMHNVLEDVPQVKTIVQVGIRDVCEQEIARAATDPRIEMFSDNRIVENRSEGISWASQCNMIIEKLPQKVYISFDIDALSPENCPNTGTPVPGGLSYNEAIFLINRIARSGRRITGFDLCEVAPGDNGGEWDANVGARVLFALCNLTLLTNP